MGGTVLWPAIALASLVQQVMFGSSLWVALAIALANALQAVIGALILRQANFDTLLARVPDMIAFIAVAIGVTALVPTIGVTAFFFTGYAFPHGIFGMWWSWWLGQMLGVLIVTPLLVRWVAYPAVRRTHGEFVEIGLAFATLITIDLLLFWTPYTEIGSVSLIYLILGPLLWLGLRIGPRFMTLALFINAALSLAGTAQRVLAGSNPQSLGLALMQTEIFVIMISIIFLVVVAIAEERKNTALALRIHVRKLEEALERIHQEDEAKSRFIATLAHELRNPLAPLMSSLEILTLENGGKNDIISGMSDHINTMRHLLDDLLDISRISRQKFILQKEYIDLHTVVEQSLRTVTPLLTSHQHTLEVELPKDALLFDADPVRLEQVLVNLLNNAIKYTEPGGILSLSARVEASTLILSVRDTGIGIESHMLDRIFEPFLQIDESSRRVSGLGIGLSLTKMLVEMHDGTVEAKSAGKGHGSEFVVRLPLRTLVRPEPGMSGPEEETAPAPLPAAGVPRSFRILVVDDNIAAAQALKKLLSLRGHAVDMAHSGAEALTMAAQMRPEVILLDIGLPDMDGYAVAKALYEQCEFPFTLVALTGYGQDSDKHKAGNSGFDHHLTKPAGLADIEAILATVE